MFVFPRGYDPEFPELSSIYPLIITSRLCGLIVSTEYIGPPSCRAEFTLSRFMYIYEKGDIRDKRFISHSTFIYNRLSIASPSALSFTALKDPLVIPTKFYNIFSI